MTSSPSRPPGGRHTPIFSNVHYLISTSFPVERQAELRHVLDSNGASYVLGKIAPGDVTENNMKEAMKDERLTTVVTNTMKFEGWEALRDSGRADAVDIVTGYWVERSVVLGKAQVAAHYSADPAMLFSGVTACSTDLPSADTEVLSAGITALGGQWRIALTKDVTHLFALSPGTAKYSTAMHFQEETGVKVLLPHWFDDAVRLGIRGLGTRCYEWPDPEMLKSPDQWETTTAAKEKDGNGRKIAELEPDIVKRNMYATAAMFTTPLGSRGPPSDVHLSDVLNGNVPGSSSNVGTPNGASATPQIRHTRTTSKDIGVAGAPQVWNNRRILLSRSLQLYKNRRDALDAGIRRQGGVVVRFEGDGDEEEEVDNGEDAAVNTVGGHTDSTLLHEQGNGHGHVNASVITGNDDGPNPMLVAQGRLWTPRRLSKEEVQRRKNEADAVAECDVYVTRYRSGKAYVLAFKSQKTIGTLAWLFHVHSTGILSRPVDQLLHYPVRETPIWGFGNHVISLTNYTGEAREYLKKLITATGASFTPAMSGQNTVLIAAFLSGTKCQKAQTWSIPVVNHTWLEDCFVQGRNLTLAKEKYIIFPEGVDFSTLLGSRGVGIGAGLENEIEELEGKGFVEDSMDIEDDNAEQAHEKDEEGAIAEPTSSAKEVASLMSGSGGMDMEVDEDEYGDPKTPTRSRAGKAIQRDQAGSPKKSDKPTSHKPSSTKPAPTSPTKHSPTKASQMKPKSTKLRAPEGMDVDYEPPSTAMAGMDMDWEFGYADHGHGDADRRADDQEGDEDEDDEEVEIVPKKAKSKKSKGKQADSDEEDPIEEEDEPEVLALDTSDEEREARKVKDKAKAKAKEAAKSKTTKKTKAKANRSESEGEEEEDEDEEEVKPKKSKTTTKPTKATSSSKKRDAFDEEADDDNDEEVEVEVEVTKPKQRAAAPSTPTKPKSTAKSPRAAVSKSSPAKPSTKANDKSTTAPSAKAKATADATSKSKKGKEKSKMPTPESEDEDENAVPVVVEKGKQKAQAKVVDEDEDDEEQSEEDEEEPVKVTKSKVKSTAAANANAKEKEKPSAKSSSKSKKHAADSETEEDENTASEKEEEPKPKKKLVRRVTVELKAPSSVTKAKGKAKKIGDESDSGEAEERKMAKKGEAVTAATSSKPKAGTSAAAASDRRESLLKTTKADARTRVRRKSAIERSDEEEDEDDGMEAVDKKGKSKASTKGKEKEKPVVKEKGKKGKKKAKSSDEEEEEEKEEDIEPSPRGEAITTPFKTKTYRGTTKAKSPVKSKTTSTSPTKVTGRPMRVYSSEDGDPTDESDEDVVAEKMKKEKKRKESMDVDSDYDDEDSDSLPVAPMLLTRKEREAKEQADAKKGKRTKEVEKEKEKVKEKAKGKGKKATAAMDTDSDQEEPVQTKKSKSKATLKSSITDAQAATANKTPLRKQVSVVIPVSPVRIKQVAAAKAKAKAVEVDETDEEVEEPKEKRGTAVATTSKSSSKKAQRAEPPTDSEEEEVGELINPKATKNRRGVAKSDSIKVVSEQASTPTSKIAAKKDKSKVASTSTSGKKVKPAVADPTPSNTTDAMEVDDDAGSTVSAAVPRRNAAAKANQRLHETIMPDLVNFESQMKKSKGKGKQSGSSLGAFALEFEKEVEVKKRKKDGDADGAEEDEGVDAEKSEKPKKKRRVSDENNGQGAGSSKPVASTSVKPVSKRGKKDNVPATSSSGVMIMTTQVSLSDADKKALTSLGVGFTQVPTECTHLLAPNLVRTEKFLCALARAPWILSAEWATESARKKTLLPERDYVLKDSVGEKRYNMSLVKTLQLAKQHEGKMLAGKLFYITQHVPVDLRLLRNVVGACGGQVTNKQPTARILEGDKGNRFIIAHQDDVSVWRHIEAAGHKIYTQELLLTGILKQEMEWDREDFMISS